MAGRVAKQRSPPCARDAVPDKVSGRASGDQKTFAVGAGLWGSAKGAEAPGFGPAAAAAQSTQSNPCPMPAEICAPPGVQSVVSLIVFIATEKLPCPPGPGQRPHIVVLIQDRGPRRADRRARLLRRCSLG